MEAHYERVHAEPVRWIVCRECERPATLCQGRTTGWIHTDDDTLACGARWWKRVPVSSIARLWAPVRWTDDPVTSLTS